MDLDFPGTELCENDVIRLIKKLRVVVKTNRVSPGNKVMVEVILLLDGVEITRSNDTF